MATKCPQRSPLGFLSPHPFDLIPNLRLRVITLVSLIYTPSAVGVVVSCEIPILASRVRFPDGARFLLHLRWSFVCCGGRLRKWYSEINEIWFWKARMSFSRLVANLVFQQLNYKRLKLTENYEISQGGVILKSWKRNMSFRQVQRRFESIS